jgi:hypothetical protein
MDLCCCYVNTQKKVISINESKNTIQVGNAVSINNKNTKQKLPFTLWQAGTTINENFTIRLTVNNRDPKGINPL